MGFDPEIEQEAAAIAEELPEAPVSLLPTAGPERLSIDLLREVIPVIRAGDNARTAWEDAGRDMPAARATELRLAMRAGEKAKERVYRAAMPLIRTVAMREMRRRQQWNSRLSLDDLVQDASIGFFKGLASFRTEAIRTSATNYLGQWMLVEMRRSAEVMDHDLQVGHDAGERFRRVRALRSRLMGDLGREPTDEEIAEASRNPAYVTRPGLVGRAPRDGEERQTGKGLTVAQVAEERTARDRVGALARLSMSNDESDDGGAGIGAVDAERVSPMGHDLGSNDPAELAADAAHHRVVAGLVSRALAGMSLPAQQTEIVSRKYGLAPHEEQSSARQIARDMGLHRERVTRVLSAFADEMRRPGGALHRVVADLTRDDLLALGLDWLADSLGEWHESYAAIPLRLPALLTEEAATLTVVADAPHVAATYRCDYDDEAFNVAVPDRSAVAREAVCPHCGRSAALDHAPLRVVA